MAEVKQGSFNVTGYTDADNTGAPYYCTFSWTLVSQNKINNTSTISWSLIVKGGSYSDSYNTVNGYQVVVNGETESDGTSQEVYNGTVLASGTEEIKHDVDGKKRFSASAKCAFEFYSYNSTGSGTWDLPSITRSATISSVGDIDIGQRCSVTWNAVAGFQYRLAFTLGSWSYITGFIKPNKTGSYTYADFQLDGQLEVNGTNLYTELSHASSGSMTVALGTYTSSGAFIYPNSKKTFTIKVPATEIPEIIDGNEFGAPFKCEPQNYNLLVQNKNMLKITLDMDYCVPGNGSTIVSYNVSGPGITGTKVLPYSDTNNLSSFYCGPFSNYGNLSYAVTAVDSRGRVSRPKTFVIYCHEYKQLEFTFFNVYRCGNDGTPNQNSEKVKCSCGFAFSPVNNTNVVSVDLSYKKQSSSDEQITLNLISSGNLNLYDGILNATFEKNSTYEVCLTITDNYGGTAKSQTVLVFGQFRAINITKDGTGIALGKMAEEPGLFDCRWPTRFKGYMHLQKDSSYADAPYIRFNTDNTSDTSAGDIMVDPTNNCMKFTNSERYLFEADKLYAGNCPLGRNKVLWNDNNGAYFPVENFDRPLEEPISNQANGIVIIFSKFENSTIFDDNFCSFFVPKQFVADFSGKPIVFNMGTSPDSMATKVLIISNTSIKGHSVNGSTANNGVNRAYVIRRVIGV